MTHTREDAFALMDLADEVMDAVLGIPKVEDAEFDKNETGDILVSTDDGRQYVITVASA